PCLIKVSFFTISYNIGDKNIDTISSGRIMPKKYDMDLYLEENLIASIFRHYLSHRNICFYKLKSIMPKNLVIVESPAKAKTIEGYLGKDYKVASSYGHVRDLPKGDKAIDIKNKFHPT